MSGLLVIPMFLPTLFRRSLAARMVNPRSVDGNPILKEWLTGCGEVSPPQAPRPAARSRSALSPQPQGEGEGRTARARRARRPERRTADDAGLPRGVRGRRG